jgi:hypothetical protein
MKGIHYDLQFTLPNKDIDIHTNIKMKDLCDLIKELFLKHYFLDDININNQVLYNLQFRPTQCSKIIRNRVNVKRHV